jgi:hypothetical protein
MHFGQTDRQITPACVRRQVTGGMMRGKLTPREKVLVAVGAVGLVVAIALLAMLIYALFEAGVTALRWWAGLATAALPLAALCAYYLGRTEARGHVAGLTQGIEAVSEAARRTADIRVSTAQRIKRQPTPAVQQVFMPGPPGLLGPGSTGVIVEAQRAEDEVEL